MDHAPIEDITARPGAHERCMRRAQALAAVKFMGLPMPLEVDEPPPSLLARVRSLLFRA